MALASRSNLRLTALALALASIGAHADTYTWATDTSGLWTLPTNWTPLGPPANGSDVVITVTGVKTITHDLGNDSIHTLNFEATAPDPNAVLLVNSGSSLTVTSGGTNGGVIRADNGTMTFSGGTLINNGTLNAINNGTIAFSNATLQGGTVSSASGGGITLGNSSFLDGTSNGAITNAGTVTAIGGNTTFVAGTIVNNGSLVVGANATLRLQGSSNATLSGIGTVTLSDANSQVFGDSGADRLTIGAGQIVQGVGNLGSNQLTVTNAGVITANQNSGTLVLDPTDGLGNFVNTGTLRAESGGTLRIQNGTFTNGGAQINALAGSNVVITGSTVIGGTLSTTGTGVVTAFNSSVLDGATAGAMNLTGNINVAGGNTVFALGTLNDNNLTIGGNATLRIQGTSNLTLANNGTLTLTDVNSQIYGDNGNDRLTNTSGNTIQGVGNIGSNQAYVTNSGLITANMSGQTLTLDPTDGIATAAGFTNSGTLRAENGGTLQLQPGFFSNNGGTISALNTSAVNINNSVIQGGTLSTAGSGTITVANSATLDGLTYGAMNLTGNVATAGGNTVYALGTLNDNSLTIGANSALRIQGSNNLTFANNGTVTMTDVNSQIFGDNGNDLLTNTAGNTIRGVGTIGSNQAYVTNAGLITANVNGQTLTLDPTDGTVAAAGFINSGTARAENGGTLALQPGVYNNNGGTISALTGSAVNINNSVIQGGTLSTVGTGVVTVFNSATLDGLTQGTLNLTGNINTAGGNTVYALGTLNDNNLTIGANSNLRIQGTNNLTLANSGTLTLTDVNSQIFGDNGNDVLTNTAGNRIQGVGNVGSNQTLIRNAGLITANIGGQTLTIDPTDGDSVNGGLINTGTLQAESGGNLQFNFGHYNNQVGTIAALTGSTVTLTNSAVIEGGTLSTSGSGTMSMKGGVVLDGTAHGALTNSGTIIGDGGITTYLTGSIVNNGAITIGANAAWRIQGATNATLSGTGTVTLTDVNTQVFGDNGNDLLTIGAGQTVRGVGNLGANQMALTNAGTISANVSGATLNVQPISTLNNQSTGTLLATSGGTLNVLSAVAGTGTIRSDSGGTVILTQAAQTGQLINNANLSIGTNNVTVSADYSNANFGTGNSFNKRSNVTGTGQILASGNVAQAITGANVTNGTTGTPTLTIGNVRVGGTTYNYQVANTGTNGPSIRGALETAVNGGNITDSRLSGSGVTASNYGPVAAGSNSGNLGVTFTVGSAGTLAPLNGQAVHVANNFDNLSEQTLNIALASGAAAYNVAIGTATPTPIPFGNVRVGTADTQTLTVRNTQTAGSFSEDLNAAFGASTGAATSSGSITHLVAGGTNNSSLTASLNTATAGAKSGSVTINYDTAGTVNGVSNGLGTLNVGSQTIALSGNVYNTAVGSTSPSPVAVANQRIGGSNSSALTVSNTAAPGNFSEALNASVSAASGGATGTGSVSNIAAGSSNASALSVGVSTATAGAKSGNVTIAYQSDGTGSNGNSGLAAIAAGSQTIAVTGNVYQTASGAILTGPLNFGTVQVGTNVSQMLSIQNTATGASGFVEDLNASFGAATGTGSSRITGSGSITGLAAGSTGNGLTVGVNTSSAGTVSGSIAVNFFSAGTVGGVSNGLGSLAVGSAGYGVSGTIQGTANVVDQANPVINNAPIALGNVRIGSTAPTGLVSVTNQATGNQQAALNASISGNAPITASGSFNLLAPGATNASALSVGFDTSTAGSKNGTATIAFVSDASNIGNCAPNCQVTLPSQNVAVTGAVYRLANPAATPGTVTVAGRVGSTSPVTAINVTNVSSDAYTEGLTVSRGATSAGFTSSGSITNLVAGGNSNAIGVTLNTATAGTFAGTQALNYVSTGAGTDGAADLAIGSGSVTLNGKVYTPAAAALNTPSVAFGIVHVGDSVAAQSVSVTNSAATTALNDVLLASATGATGPFTASGSLGTGLASQATSTALKVGLNTSTAGVYTGSATFSAASHDADLSDVALANLAVGLTGQVNNYASDAFVFGSGAGTLTQSGSTFILDYGTVAQGSGTRSTTLVADNAATGPADLLDGMFQFLDPADFAETGFSSFTNLAAGQTTGGLMLSFNAMTVGNFTDTITLHGVGHNGSGYSASIGDIQLIVRGAVSGQVTPPSGVPEPDSLLLLGLGIPLLFLRRRRQGQSAAQ